MFLGGADTPGLSSIMSRKGRASSTVQKLSMMKENWSINMEGVGGGGWRRNPDKDSGSVKTESLSQ